MSDLSLNNFLIRFTGRKTAKNYDGHKRPLLEAQTEESFQKSFSATKCDFTSMQNNEKN